MPKRLDSFLQGVDSSLLLNAIFYALPTGICLFDRHRKAMFVNMRFCEIFGYECSMLNVYDQVSIMPESVIRDIAERYSALLETPPGDEENVLETEDVSGKPLYLRIKAANYEMPDGASFKIVSVVDVTDIIRTARLEQEAERVMRHDLRSMVGSMGNAASLINMRGGVGKEHGGYLDYITETSERAIALIDQLRENFLMEEGLYELSPEDCDICEILERLRKQFQNLIEGKQIDLQVLYRGGPLKRDQVRMSGEKRLLERMLGNVLKNALEAVPEGGAVRVFVESDDKVSIRVRSQSRVPAAMHERFFEKYATTKHYGTGLGNYIARLIARTHGGEATVEYGPDRDTDVIIMLPGG